MRIIMVIFILFCETSFVIKILVQSIKRNNLFIIIKFIILTKLLNDIIVVNIQIIKLNKRMLDK